MGNVGRSALIPSRILRFACVLEIRFNEVDSIKELSRLDESLRPFGFRIFTREKRRQWLQHDRSEFQSRGENYPVVQFLRFCLLIVRLHLIRRRYQRARVHFVHARDG